MVEMVEYQNGSFLKMVSMYVTSVTLFKAWMPQCLKWWNTMNHIIIVTFLKDQDIELISWEDEWYNGWNGWMVQWLKASKLEWYNNCFLFNWRCSASWSSSIKRSWPSRLSSVECSLQYRNDMRYKSDT